MVLPTINDLDCTKNKDYSGWRPTSSFTSFTTRWYPIRKNIVIQKAEHDDKIWCAFFDGDEESGNRGWGKTTIAAVTELLEFTGEKSRKFSLIIR
jgi:hypothetical protein